MSDLYGSNRPSTAGQGTPDPVPTDHGSGQDTASQAREAAATAADQGKHVAGVAREQAGQVAGEAATQARRVVDDARRQVTSTLDEQARGQQDRLGGTLRSLGEELDEMAQHGSGLAGDLARDAAGRTRELGRYLSEREPGELLDDVRDFARRRPGVFLLGALAAGVAVGRLARGVTDGARAADAGLGEDGAPTSGETATAPAMSTPAGSSAGVATAPSPTAPGALDPTFDPAPPGGAPGVSPPLPPPPAPPAYDDPTTPTAGERW